MHVCMLYMCVCVCVCARAYVYVCIYICIYIYIYIYIYRLEGSHCIIFSNIRICFFKAVIGSEIATCFTQIYIKKINHRTEIRG